MDDRLYQTLKYTAIVLTVLWLGWTAYDGLMAEQKPGDGSYLAGNTAFEDERYEKALRDYEEALHMAPDHIHALRGKARTLLQLGHLQEALTVFDRAIAAEPAFAAAYANRGVVHDRMGRYEKAISDYEKALLLNPELADGPGWMTRFLRNQAEKPPTIADRARYLRKQQAKPAAERLLRQPDEDKKQRPYKM